MAKKDKKEKKDPKQVIIDTAIKRLKQAAKADEHNRQAAIDDLKFAHGDQWPDAEKKRRSDKGRPALTLNFLPKFIDQVVGDMLHNSPSIKIRPEDSKADINIAKIRQGIISNIEYQSNSKGIYGYAGKQMVTCGYGGWRVLTRYVEENPFMQEIYLEGIRNPFLLYMDPSAKDQNYADAKWGMLLERIPTDDFKEKYPDAMVPSELLKEGTGLGNELWYDADNVTVAEYFTREEETVPMCQLEDGRVVTEEEYKELRAEWKEDFKELLNKIENIDPTKPPETPPIPEGGMPPMPGQPPMPPIPAPSALPENLQPKVINRRDSSVMVVRHWILTACEILEGDEEGNKVAGKLIPLVLLKGKELNIEGKNNVYSLIRHAKDPQKLINYWNTAAAETIALAPKAPWVATPKQIEGHETAYASANVENFPVLLYNTDPEAPGPPQRQGAGQPPVAIFEQIRRGEDNLKSVIGMFNADVGGPGSEQTGAAITARQRPGDIATFEFMENLARAVLYTGRIINEMIPEIYDTERDVRIMGNDDTESFIPVNTTVGSALKSVEKHPEHFNAIDPLVLKSIFAKEGKDAKYNDVTVGKYGVVVSTGPSYATQRQEAAQHLMQLTQAMPQQMAIAADLLVESMDFKNADELAARLRKQLPPNLVKPRPGEAPPAPPQPPPQVLLAQAKVENEKTKGENLKMKMQVEMAKAQKGTEQNNQDPIEAIKLQMEKMKMEHERIMMKHDEDAAALRVKTEELRLKAELEKQQMSIQYQREAHQIKMVQNTNQ